MATSCQQCAEQGLQGLPAPLFYDEVAFKRPSAPNEHLAGSGLFPKRGRYTLAIRAVPGIPVWLEKNPGQKNRHRFPVRHRFPLRRYIPCRGPGFVGAVGTVVEGAQVYATQPPNDDIVALTGQTGRVGGPGHTFVAVGGTLYGLSPNKGGVFEYSGTPGQWTQVGGPAGEIYGGGAGLFATNPQTGDIYAYNNFYGGAYREGWTKIGGPGRMFAVGGVLGELASANRYLYGLAPDGASVDQLDFSAMRWTQIGGPAASIYAGADRLYATNPQSGDIWEYFQVEQRWMRIGGPGRMFAVASATGALYGLSPDGGAVFRYTGVLDGWERIGGAAESIYAGRNALVFATNPQTHDLWYLEIGASLPPIPKPLDLVWSSVDPNGLPLNPKLGWQVRPRMGPRIITPMSAGN